MVLIHPINVPEAGLVYTSNNTQLKIGHRIIGTGTLYINQDSLDWMPVDRPEGLSIEWKQISVHGISSNPVKCIYVMIDHKLVWEGVYGDEVDDLDILNGDELLADLINGDASDIESDNEEMTELWLIPSDANTVDSIYQAMTDCQALHPDSADSLSESGSDYMDFDGDENEDGAGGNVGGNVQDLNINDERFADAEE